MKLPSIDVAPQYLTSTIGTLLQYIVDINSQKTFDLTGCDSPYVTPWKYSWVLLSEYVDRLKEFIPCCTESFVVAACLFKRLDATGFVPLINGLSAHRIYAVCLMLATKIMEDETLSNKDYAKVFCLQLKELNELEVYTFQLLGSSCFVRPEEFLQVKRELVHFDILLTRASKNPAELSRLGMREEGTPLSLANMCTDLTERASSGRQFRTVLMDTIRDSRRDSAPIPQSAQYATESATLKKDEPIVVPLLTKRRASLMMIRSIGPLAASRMAHSERHGKRSPQSFL
jgi:hypothetical protein